MTMVLKSFSASVSAVTLLLVDHSDMRLSITLMPAMVRPETNIAYRSFM